MKISIDLYLCVHLFTNKCNFTGPLITIKRKRPNAFQDEGMQDPFNVNYHEDAFHFDLNELPNKHDE